MTSDLPEQRGFPDRPIRPDVGSAGYIHGSCPNCGRHRLEVYVDGPESTGTSTLGNERAVGVRCEKCHAAWLLDPSEADFHGDYSNSDPLKPALPDNDIGGTRSS